AAFTSTAFITAAMTPIRSSGPSRSPAGVGVGSSTSVPSVGVGVGVASSGSIRGPNSAVGTAGCAARNPTKGDAPTAVGVALGRAVGVAVGSGVQVGVAGGRVRVGLAVG